MNDGWIRGNLNDSSWMMLNLLCLSVRIAVCYCASNFRGTVGFVSAASFQPLKSMHLWRQPVNWIEQLSMSHASHACLESFLKLALKGKGPIFNQPYLLHLLLQFHLSPLCSAHMHQMVQHSTCSFFLCRIYFPSANILNCTTSRNSWWCLVVLLVTVLALWCHRTTGNKSNNLIELQSSAMTFFIFFEHRNPWQIRWICSLHTVLVNHAACLGIKIHEACFSFLCSSHWMNLWFRPAPPPVFLLYTPDNAKLNSTILNKSEHNIAAVRASRWANNGVFFWPVVCFPFVFEYVRVFSACFRHILGFHSFCTTFHNQQSSFLSCSRSFPWMFQCVP